MKTSALLAASAAIAASAAMVAADVSATETEYVELDYVEATGAQWVDTGITGRCGTKAEIKVEWMDLSEDTQMLACRGDGDTRINLLNANGSKIGYGYGVYSNVYYTASAPRQWEQNRIYTVVTDFAASGDGASVSMTVDGKSIVDHQPYGTSINTGTNLVIFGNNIKGVVDLARLSRSRCYGLKIWQDG